MGKQTERFMMKVQHKPLSNKKNVEWLEGSPVAFPTHISTFTLIAAAWATDYIRTIHGLLRFNISVIMTTDNYEYSIFTIYYDDKLIHTVWKKNTVI